MEEDFEYAGLGKSFAALIIDYLIFCALFFPVTRIIKGTWLMTPQDHDWNWGLFIFDPVCLAFLIFIFSYFIIFEALTGYTPGKYFCKIRVVTTEGRIPGLGKSIIRNFLRMIDGLPAMNIIGIYLILTTPEHTRFGDKVAKTRVIHTNR